MFGPINRRVKGLSAASGLVLRRSAGGPRSNFDCGCRSGGLVGKCGGRKRLTTFCSVNLIVGNWLRISGGDGG